jgi:hypothetical protein
VPIIEKEKECMPMVQHTLSMVHQKTGSAKALPAFLCGLAQEDLKGSGSE